MSTLGQLPQGLLRFRHGAMATDWELLVPDMDEGEARFMAEEAWKAVDAAEDELSHFVETSDVSRINRLASGESTMVAAETFACLARAVRVHRDTGGAFDLTVGALIKGRKAWRDQEEGIDRVVEAQGPVRVGMHLLTLDESTLRVGVKDGRVSLDLGGIGKGFALDMAFKRLREWDMERFLLSGGRSTFIMCGVGAGDWKWPFRWLDPRDEKTELGRFRASNCAVSISSNVNRPHIFDPRTRKPAQRRWIGAWVYAPSAAEADALSTAFMVMDEAGIAAVCRARPKVAAVMAEETGLKKSLSLRRFGCPSAYHEERKQGQ